MEINAALLNSKNNISKTELMNILTQFPSDYSGVCELLKFASSFLLPSLEPFSTVSES